MRQLNQLYAEIKVLQGLCTYHTRIMHLAKFYVDMLLRVPNGSRHHSAVKPLNVKSIEPSIAVLVIACNRVDYVKQTLDELLK